VYENLFFNEFATIISTSASYDVNGGVYSIVANEDDDSL
jgi:hypothetical protein